MGERGRVARMYQDIMDLPSSDNEITSTTFLGDEVKVKGEEEEPLDTLGPHQAIVSPQEANELSLFCPSDMESRLKDQKANYTSSLDSAIREDALFQVTENFCAMSSNNNAENQTDTIPNSICLNDHPADANTSVGIEYNKASTNTDSSNFMSENGDEFDIFRAKLVSMLLSFTSRDPDRQDSQEVKDESEPTSTCQRLTVLESRPKWSSRSEAKIDQRKENLHFHNEARQDLCTFVSRNKCRTFSTVTSKPSSRMFSAAISKPSSRTFCMTTSKQSSRMFSTATSKLSPRTISSATSEPSSRTLSTAAWKPSSRTFSTATSKPSDILPTSFDQLKTSCNSHLKRSDSFESLLIAQKAANQMEFNQDSQPLLTSGDGVRNISGDVMMMRSDTGNGLDGEEFNEGEHQSLDTVTVDSSTAQGYRCSKQNQDNDCELNLNGKRMGIKSVQSGLRYAEQNSAIDTAKGIFDSGTHFETCVRAHCDGDCCSKDGRPNPGRYSDPFPWCSQHGTNGVQTHMQTGYMQMSRSQRDKSRTGYMCCDHEIVDAFNYRTSFPRVESEDNGCPKHLDFNTTKHPSRFSLSAHTLTRFHQDESQTTHSKNRTRADSNTNSSTLEKPGESLYSLQSPQKQKDSISLTHPGLVSANIVGHDVIPLPPPRAQPALTSRTHPLGVVCPFQEQETLTSASHTARDYGKGNHSTEHSHDCFHTGARTFSSKSRSKHKFTPNSTFASQRQSVKKSRDMTSDQRESRHAKSLIYNGDVLAPDDKILSSNRESTSNQSSQLSVYDQFEIAKSRDMTSERRMLRHGFHDQSLPVEKFHTRSASKAVQWCRNTSNASKLPLNPSSYDLDFNIDLENLHWMRVKSISDTTPTAMASSGKCRLPPCRVCGDKASGLHFGVNSCEACNEFFRRTLKKSNSQQYACTKGGHCDVTGKKRSSCSHCRFQKCLSLGMCRQAIKTGRYSHQKRTQYTMEVKHLERVMERREKERQMTDMTQDLLQKYRHFFAPSSPEDSPLSPFQAHDSEIFGKSRHFRPAPSVDDVMTEKYMQEEAKCTEEWIRRLVKFVKHVTIFEGVTLTDQAALIRMSWFEIRFLDSFRHFCPDTQMASDPTRRLVTFDQLATLHSQNLAADIFRVAGKLKRLNVGDDELILMKCLYLTLSDRHVLEDQVKVMSLTEFITDALLHTLARNRPDRAAILFPRIVDCFVELRSLAMTYFQGFSNFYVHHVTKNSQLLAEMIPLRDNV